MNKSIIGAYVALMVVVLLVLAVRGPLREHAWGEDCRALVAGEPIQAPESNLTILEVCNDLVPQ